MIKYLYHGTSSHYLPQINQTGLPASLSGFGQTGLSGVGLTESLATATSYAKSTAKSTGSQPVVLVVEARGSWADLRELNIPDEIYDLEAAKEGIDPDNIQEFKLEAKTLKGMKNEYEKLADKIMQIKHT
jgi:hypothetical protein